MGKTGRKSLIRSKMKRLFYSIKRNNLKRRLLFIAILCSALCNWAAAETLNEKPFRIGFSQALFSDVHEADARAAIKSWAHILGHEKNVPIEPAPQIFRNQDELESVIKNGSVDAVGITVLEYHQLLADTDFSRIFMTRIAGSLTERFVLLAHRQGSVAGLNDLLNRKLTIFDNSRTILAPLWLDNLLYRQGLGATAETSIQVQTNQKLTNVVLPVFFRQVDACLVTKSGFEIMAELNPQVGKDLFIVAESSDVVPIIFAFRDNYQPTFLDTLLTGLSELDKSSAGSQILNIFQSDSIEEQPRALLDSALDLIKEHEKLPL
jgi:phosphonate transport system substrate-binding protein